MSSAYSGNKLRLEQIQRQVSACSTYVEIITGNTEAQGHIRVSICDHEWVDNVLHHVTFPCQGTYTHTYTSYCGHLDLLRTAVDRAKALHPDRPRAWPLPGLVLLSKSLKLSGPPMKIASHGNYKCLIALQ